jgi:L-Ala-D/L-Glu epimerase
MIVGETQDTGIALAKDFAAILKGKDPLDISSRMKDLHGYVAHNSTIKSAFDMALYDVASKSANIPLYQFLGGDKRVIQTDITIGIGRPEEMEAQAKEFKLNGASILKVKLGKNVDEDFDRIRRIRNAVGRDLAIRIDANQGYSFEDAVYFLKMAADLDIEFCEQPMKKGLNDYLPELRKASPIKIMADESCFDHHDARKLIKEKACDYINIKFSKSGGILEALNIYRTATDAGTPCMIGGMLESRIALSAKVHFAYACPQINLFDLDTCLLGHLEDPAVGGVNFDGYHLDISDSPGIGADANEKFLQKCEKWEV